MAGQNNSQEALQQAIVAAHKDYLDSITPKRRLPREFLHGIVHGLGIAVGSTMIFALAAFLFGKFLLIPGVNEIVEQIKENAPQGQQH